MPAVKHGRTIALAHLTQQVPPENRTHACFPASRHPSGDPDRHGQDVSASSMLERFGFTGDKLNRAHRRPLRWGAGGFQLLKLLLASHVLLLDEPTNDLDIDNPQRGRDFLDCWQDPGGRLPRPLLLERVTDSVWRGWATADLDAAQRG